MFEKRLHWILAAMLCAGLGTAGCDDDTDDDDADMMVGGEGEGEMTFPNPAAIEGYISGKTLVMAGDDIPSHPNGFSEDLDLGPNTQCYNRVALTFDGGAFNLMNVPKAERLPSGS